MALTLSPLRASAVAIVLVLLVATGSAIAQPPTPSSRGNTDELVLTATEEKDSYEIYSILLRTEMPPQWNITGWAITQETQTFPDTNGRGPGACLQFPVDQKSTYLPLIEDYVTKNMKKLMLKRKFDLPTFALIGPVETKAIQERWQPRAASSPSSNSADVSFPLDATVIFQISAVGFNADRNRALVYVGHNCGGLCGGGTYHLLVKKDGKWQVDRGYRGASCMWAS
jgi:hypothetical protein